MAEGTDNRPAPAPLELLGIEALEEHARRLAALFTTSQTRRGGNAHLKALRKHSDALKHVYTALADDAKRGEPSSPAAEWLLDNFHIVLASLRDIHHDSPRRSSGGCRASPPTNLPACRGFTQWRSQLIRCGAGRLDRQRLQRFLTAFQTISPLTMRALGVAVGAQSALIEHLRNRVGRPGDQPRRAVAGRPIGGLTRRSGAGPQPLAGACASGVRHTVAATLSRARKRCGAAAGVGCGAGVARPDG